MDTFTQAQESASAVRKKLGGSFDFAIVTGTGFQYLRDLGHVVGQMDYAEVPYLGKATVSSHQNCIYSLEIGNKMGLLFMGRLHYYEGHSMGDVTFPVRIIQALDINNLLLTCSAGGLNPHYQAGDMVFLKDHISLFPENPLRGENDPRLGLRFPDLKDAYDRPLLEVAKHACHYHGFPHYRGVYVGLQGPSLETPAEYKYLRAIGGDLVGMSTVPEVQVAVHAGLRVLALAIVSNVGYPIEHLSPTTIEEVVAASKNAAPRVNQVLKSILVEI